MSGSLSWVLAVSYLSICFWFCFNSCANAFVSWANRWMPRLSFSIALIFFLWLHSLCFLPQMAVQIELGNTFGLYPPIYFLSCFLHLMQSSLWVWLIKIVHFQHSNSFKCFIWTKKLCNRCIVFCIPPRQKDKMVCKAAGVTELSLQIWTVMVLQNAVWLFPGCLSVDYYSRSKKTINMEGGQTL